MLCYYPDMLVNVYVLRLSTKIQQISQVIVKWQFINGVQRPTQKKGEEIEYL